MRIRVEEELDRLERQWVYEKVAYSKFASPNVAVLKDVNEPAGPIRLCGDYKVSIQIFILKFLSHSQYSGSMNNFWLRRNIH